VVNSFKCIKNIDLDLWEVFVKEAKARKLTTAKFFKELLLFYFSKNPCLADKENKGGVNDGKKGKGKR
jgi:hypothetical protein